MAETLTPQQKAAVENRGGRLLVSAAAGSGKTKVLVDRLIGYLNPSQLQTEGTASRENPTPADINDFLIITYTKAAAAELRMKIADRLSAVIAEHPENRHMQRQMQLLYMTQISTVHSFCSVILKEYAHMIGLTPDFRVADEMECQELQNLVMTSLMEEAYIGRQDLPHFFEFIDQQGVGRNDSSVPALILQVYNSSRCHMDPEKWLERCLQNTEAEGISDISQLPWGEMLIEDLHSFLDEQFLIMNDLTSQTEYIPTMAKQSALLRTETEMLQKLRDCKSWDALSRASISFGTLRFSKADQGTDLAERIKASRDACKETLRKKMARFTDSSSQILQDLSQCRSSASGLIELVRLFGKEYQRAKQSRHVLDFGDLEHMTLDLLYGKSRSGITQAAREIGSRYREVLIDEYQDSNAVQDAIFTALTEQRRNSFMVGDVKQSIYQFRLADPTIFLEKYHSYRLYEEAQANEGRKVLLSKNFRSGAEILDSVNDVFSVCMSPEVGGLVYGEAEQLYAGVERSPLPDNAVEFHLLKTPNESGVREAAFTAQLIRQMLDSGSCVRDGSSFRPVKPDDIVILLRSPNSAADDYQKALEANGIRCFRGSNTDLLNTQEVIVFRALLQVIDNPRQDIPLLSVLASPLFGFTADDLAQIRSEAKGDFYDALSHSAHPKAQSFCTVLEQLRKEAALRPLTELMQHCMNITRMDSIFGAMDGGEARRENLQNFFLLASDYEQSAFRYPDQFLKHLDSLQNSGKMSSSSSNSGCVTIMSIHKSKGLEFPVVFLCNLARKFNTSDSKSTVLCHKQLGLGLSVVDIESRFRYPSAAKQAIASLIEKENISEELRVLYVAMTRARDRLIMTAAISKPENDLSDIAKRISAGGTRMLCQEASSPADWVLTAAIQHTEAGELHSTGDRPGTTHLPEYPWKIRFHDLSEFTAGSASSAASPNMDQPVKEAPVREDLAEELSFSYPYTAACTTPSKQTATGRKTSSEKENEAAEFTPSLSERPASVRLPSFRNRKPSGGTEFGNTVHKVMQFIDFQKCCSKESVTEELLRLVQHRLISEEQAMKIQPEIILHFFQSDIGQKLAAGTPCVREFKFSLLDDASRYSACSSGEQVLLQGVVDCAVIEPDGITIIDFKTDRIPVEGSSSLVNKYRPQLDVYSGAMSRIYELPIKAAYLYFFRNSELQKV